MTEATGVDSSWPHELVRGVPPLAVLLGLVLWATLTTGFPVPNAPPGAAWVLGGLTIISAFLARWFRVRFRVDSHTARALPDPLFALYLACAILAGTPAAVLVAGGTPLVTHLLDMPRHPEALWRAIRQSAATALSTFFAGLAYVAVSATLATSVTTLRARLIGALLASAIMLGGVGVTRAVEDQHRVGDIITALRAYFAGPSIRFQALLLCLGPLLPLAEVLDDAEDEFAWILFLVPLCVVYYLALVSVRLQQRTSELQDTVAQLGVARRREAELSDYAALVTRAQEDERRRLARELHDDTAQALIALSRGLDALASRPVEPPLSSYDAHFVGQLGELAKRTLESVRVACQDLRPSVLDDLGLAAALESLAHSLTQRGLPCVFEQDGERITLAPEVEVTIYRIAQEALSNARQHAQAAHATVTISYSVRRVELHVTDDGSGFDYGATLRDHAGTSADAPGDHVGLGLLGMRERAGLIGAQLRVESIRGAGTQVALSVPLSQEQSPPGLS